MISDDTGGDHPQAEERYRPEIRKRHGVPDAPPTTVSD
jgi:hypothetical protein